VVLYNTVSDEMLSIGELICVYKVCVRDTVSVSVKCQTLSGVTVRSCGSGLMREQETGGRVWRILLRQKSEPLNPHSPERGKKTLSTHLTRAHLEMYYTVYKLGQCYCIVGCYFVISHKNVIFF